MVRHAFPLESVGEAEARLQQHPAGSGMATFGQGIDSVCANDAKGIIQHGTGGFRGIAAAPMGPCQPVAQVVLMMVGVHRLCNPFQTGPPHENTAMPIADGPTPDAVFRVLAADETDHLVRLPDVCYRLAA